MVRFGYEPLNCSHHTAYAAHHKCTHFKDSVHAIYDLYQDLYSSLSHLLWQKMVVNMARCTDFNPLNWTHLLLITTTIIACIAMAFVIVLNFRYKALIAMMPVVKADHNFIYTQITTTPATNIDTHQIWLDFQDLISNILTKEILILFILILILLLLAIFFIHRCYEQRKPRTKLILEIISDTRILITTVLSLRYCAEFYRLNVQQSDFILSPTFIGHNLHWGNSIDISELPREIKLNFARAVYLNPWESFLAGKNFE